MFTYLLIGCTVYLGRPNWAIITTGLTSRNETYACFPPEMPCPTGNLGHQNRVDPRIVVPNELCPSGLTPCYGVRTQCGTRARKSSDKDGNSEWGAHPWQAYLRNTTHEFAGSGALLDEFHMTTAGHKVAGNVENPAELTVYMGVWDPKDLSKVQATVVREVFLHPSFNRDILFNDIAVLRLKNPIVLGVQDNINAICRPDFGVTFNGATCQVSGWGQTSFATPDAPTSPQKQVTVTVADSETCRTSFARSHLLSNNVDTYLDQIGEICAGGEAARDACTGDGGAPLVCPDATGVTYRAAGLAIWGKNCGQPGVYGVYVNISYYSDWIAMTIDYLTMKYA